MAITKAQNNYVNSSSAVSSIAVPLTSAQTAGNANFVFVVWSSTAIAISSVVDTKGNVYQQVGTSLANSTLCIIAVYLCPKIVAAAASANTVTVTFASAVNFPEVQVIEWAGGGADGLTAESVANVTGNANSTTANAVTTGSFTVTHVPSLMVGCIGTTGAIITAGSTWTLIQATSFSNMVESKALSTGGSQTSTATASTTNSPFAYKVVNLYSARNATVAIASGSTATLAARRLISGTNSIATGNTLALTPPVMHNATLAVASRTTSTVAGQRLTGGVVVIVGGTTSVASGGIRKQLSASIASGSSMVATDRVLVRALGLNIGSGTSMLNGPKVLRNSSTSIASRTSSVETAIDQINTTVTVASRTQMTATERLLQRLVATISGRTTETATPTVRLGGITDSIQSQIAIALTDRVLRNGTVNIIGKNSIIAIPYVYRPGTVAIASSIGTAFVDRVIRLAQATILTQCQMGTVDRVLRRSSVGIASGNVVIATYTGAGTNNVVILSRTTTVGAARVLRGGSVAIASKNTVGAVPQWARLLVCAVASKNTLAATAQAIHQANVSIQSQIQEVLTDRELARGNVLIGAGISIIAAGTQKATLNQCMILTRCQMTVMGTRAFMAGAHIRITPALAVTFSPALSVTSRVFKMGPRVISISGYSGPPPLGGPPPMIAAIHPRVIINASDRVLTSGSVGIAGKIQIVAALGIRTFDSVSIAGKNTIVAALGIRKIGSVGIAGKSTVVATPNVVSSTGSIANILEKISIVGISRVIHSGSDSILTQCQIVAIPRVILNSGSVSIAEKNTITATSRILSSGSVSITGKNTIVATPTIPLKTRTCMILTANMGNPPATNYAVWGTRNNTPILSFNDTTAWSTFFVGIIPEGSNLGSGLYVKILWAAASATTGAVKWNVQLERVNTTIDSDSYDTLATVTTTTNGTNGIPTLTTITLTTIDSITPEDTFRLLVTRDAANAADTMVGDAQLISVEVRTVV